MREILYECLEDPLKTQLSGHAQFKALFTCNVCVCVWFKWQLKALFIPSESESESEKDQRTSGKDRAIIKEIRFAFVLYELTFTSAFSKTGRERSKKNANTNTYIKADIMCDSAITSDELLHWMIMMTSYMNYQSR